MPKRMTDHEYASTVLAVIERQQAEAERQRDPAGRFRDKAPLCRVRGYAELGSRPGHGVILAG